MSSNQSSPGRLEYKWIAMIVVSIGNFMSTLDASIVNISLPTIMASLHTNLATVQWVVSIYLLIITGLLLTLGRLSDLVGRKPIYIAGFAIFTVGSLICGLSGSIYLLIAFRGLQAIGAAMMMANGPAIIADAFPGRERGKAMGIMGTVVGLGLTVGPPLGGFLIAASGWPLIFFINIPIGIIGIVMAQLLLRHERKGFEHHFDIPGAALLLVSLTALTLALSQGSEPGWRPYILPLMATFLVSGIAFIIRERTTVHPVLDLGILRNRLFGAASVSALIAYVAMFAVVFLMPFYLSQVLKLDPKQMGLLLITVPLAAMVFAPLSGILSDKFGSQILGSLGLLIMSIGLLLISRLGGAPSTAQIVTALAVTGIGSGIFQAPNNSAIMGSVAPSRLGVASGMLATMRNLGMVTGIAISGAVYSMQVLRYTPLLGPVHASVHAFRDAFTIGAVICFVGVLTSAVRGAGTTSQS